MKVSCKFGLCVCLVATVKGEGGAEGLGISSFTQVRPLLEAYASF